MSRLGQTISDLPDDAVRITDSIAAVMDSGMDWRVFEELSDGRWSLIDVKRSLREVRQQYDPDTFPMESNPGLDDGDETTESTWKDVGRFENPHDAFNYLTEMHVRSVAPMLTRVEEVPSRSRPGHTSFVAQMRWVEGKKQSLDILEKRYCDSVPSRRTSRNPASRFTTRRRTSRSAVRRSAKRTSRR